MGSQLYTLQTFYKHFFILDWFLVGLFWRQKEWTMWVSPSSFIRRFLNCVLYFFKECNVKSQKNLPLFRSRRPLYRPHFRENFPLFFQPEHNTRGQVLLHALYPAAVPHLTCRCKHFHNRKQTYGIYIYFTHNKISAAFSSFKIESAFAVCLCVGYSEFLHWLHVFSAFCRERTILCKFKDAANRPVSLLFSQQLNVLRAEWREIVSKWHTIK